MRAPRHWGWILARAIVEGVVIALFVVFVIGLIWGLGGIWSPGGGQ